MTEATLKTLVTFNVANGSAPQSSLTADAAGNLFGTTAYGGASENGTVYEVAAGSLAFSTVATFDGANGRYPLAGLIADAAGNLYGTTQSGGANEVGTIFKLAAGSHALTTLASFGGTGGSAPLGSLALDAQGNLYGTTFVGGDNNDGTIFELAAGSQTITTLISFSDSTGFYPEAGLVADRAGNLYGTTFGGGTAGDGTVFKVTAGSHSLVTLFTFTGPNGSAPAAGLTADAAGNLYGTTSSGGPSNAGTVFRLAAGTLAFSTLASFSGSNGSAPLAGLLIDSGGNLFGTTAAGGANDQGMVFELAAGASVPTTLFSFAGDDGQAPQGGLVADAAGELFGTTSGGGPTGDGTVFELLGSGFEAPAAPCYCPGTRIATEWGERAVEHLRIGDRVATLGGVLRPIRWIGRRAYAGAFVAGRPLMLPVCLKADALAPGLPSSDLWVSPGHALFLDGQLVPAWRLVNGVSVIQPQSVDQVHYVHIELDRHDVIFANGVPAESFLDESCRGQFHNAAEYYARYASAASLAPFAARLEDGFGLQSLHDRIARRAGVCQAARPPGPLRGFADVLAPGLICGWAQDAHAPEHPVRLEVSAGGQPFASVLANRYRADLRDAGCGSGCHAFELQPIPGVVGPIEIRRVADRALLRPTTAARDGATGHVRPVWDILTDKVA